MSHHLLRSCNPQINVLSIVSWFPINQLWSSPTPGWVDWCYVLPDNILLSLHAQLISGRSRMLLDLLRCLLCRSPSSSYSSRLSKTIFLSTTGFIFIASAVPETSGKTEAEISMLFQKVFLSFLSFHHLFTLLLCQRNCDWIVLKYFPEGRQQYWEGKPSNTYLEMSKPQKAPRMNNRLEMWPQSSEWPMKLKCFTSVNKLYSKMCSRPVISKITSDPRKCQQLWLTEWASRFYTNIIFVIIIIIIIQMCPNSNCPPLLSEPDYYLDMCVDTCALVN